MKKAIKIVVILLVVVLLFGVFMLIRKLSNNFTTDVKTFYLMLDGQMVSGNTTGLKVLDKDIEVHTVGESISGKNEYTYKIVRNNSAGSFTFYLDGEKHSLADQKDYTKGFEVTKDNGKLHIKSCSLSEVLNRVFGEGLIELPDMNKETCYFTLVVSSSDGKQSIGIDFAVAAYITDIKLDKTSLEF